MRIDILTLFTEMCDRVLCESIIGRARAKGIIETHCHNITRFGKTAQHIENAAVPRLRGSLLLELYVVLLFMPSEVV